MNGPNQNLIKENEGVNQNSQFFHSIMDFNINKYQN